MVFLLWGSHLVAWWSPLCIEKAFPLKVVLNLQNWKLLRNYQKPVPNIAEFNPIIENLLVWIKVFIRLRRVRRVPVKGIGSCNPEGVLRRTDHANLLVDDDNVCFKKLVGCPRWTKQDQTPLRWTHLNSISTPLQTTTNEIRSTKVSRNDSGVFQQCYFNCLQGAMTLQRQLCWRKQQNTRMKENPNGNDMLRQGEALIKKNIYKRWDVQRTEHSLHKGEALVTCEYRMELLQYRRFTMRKVLLETCEENLNSFCISCWGRREEEAFQVYKVILNRTLIFTLIFNKHAVILTENSVVLTGCPIVSRTNSLEFREINHRDLYGFEGWYGQWNSLISKGISECLSFVSSFNLKQFVCSCRVSKKCMFV